MTPIVFINCRRVPFVDQIMNLLKLYETRSRNTLGKLIGMQILIAETGHGKPVVKCSAVIRSIIAVYTPEAYEKYRSGTCVLVDSDYDWKQNTKVKYLYELADVHQVEPFVPPEGIRHGYVWMEYYGKEV